ncbi:MAG TPA: hypothetical protein VLI06_07305 [Solimonas sp.]|nr:hypothetical protein [Solimonas sp.]
MTKQWRGAMATLVLGAGLLSTAVQAGDAGRVVLAEGGVSVTRDGRMLPVRQGTVLMAGDVVGTSVDGGHVEWQAGDEAYFSLNRGSSFKIQEFSADEGGRATYSLERGLYAAISGTIKTPDRHWVETEAARIEVNGTKYKSAACKGNCRTRNGGSIADGTYVGVDEGQVTMSNRAGKLTLGAGQFGYAASPNTAPVLLEGPPDIFLGAEAGFDFDFEFNIDPGLVIERPASPS